jgi:anti-sigma regulatory factor (Ser/Thr protein kinase)
MPYLECPGCRLSLYSAASHSWVADSCPVCGTSLEGASKQFPSEVGARTLCREFPSTPGAIGRARHALDGFYAELGDEVHMTAVLLISELVSNSVKYSKVSNGVIELVACVTPSVVRIEVSDDGEGFEPRPAAHHDAESGRGMELLQELADRWGRPTGLRTSVWFELDRPMASVNGSATTPALARTRELRLAT